MTDGWHDEQLRRWFSLRQPLLPVAQKMTYTEDRETFEAQLFRPPHAARMTDHAGHFVERLDKEDKHALLTLALDRLWETRDQIHETQDVLRMWVKALEHAARSRPYWVVYFNVYEKRRVKGSQLGKQS